MKLIRRIKRQLAICHFVGDPVGFIGPSFKIHIRSNLPNLDRRDLLYAIANVLVVVFNNSLRRISVEPSSYVDSIRI
jgi:hypothetical protein